MQKGNRISASEKQQPNQQQHWQHNREREFENVAEERGRVSFLMISDSLDHEVWAVANVGIGAKENRANADSFQASDRERIAQQQRHLRLFPRYGAAQQISREMGLQGRDSLLDLFAVRTNACAQVAPVRIHVGDDFSRSFGGGERSDFGAQKTQISGRIVEEARQSAAAPKEQARPRLA